MAYPSVAEKSSLYLYKLSQVNNILFGDKKITFISSYDISSP
jgi:hypothetical protein